MSETLKKAAKAMVKFTKTMQLFNSNNGMLVRMLRGNRVAPAMGMSFLKLMRNVEALNTELWSCFRNLKCINMHLTATGFKDSVDFAKFISSWITLLCTLDDVYEPKIPLIMQKNKQPNAVYNVLEVLKTIQTNIETKNNQTQCATLYQCIKDIVEQFDREFRPLEQVQAPAHAPSRRTTAWDPVNNEIWVVNDSVDDRSPAQQVAGSPKTKRKPLDQCTVKELREKAKSKIKGWYSMNRHELISALKSL
jgi:hypothetical protein